MISTQFLGKKAPSLLVTMSGSLSLKPQLPHLSRPPIQSRPISYQGSHINHLGPGGPRQTPQTAIHTPAMAHFSCTGFLWAAVDNAAIPTTTTTPYYLNNFTLTIRILPYFDVWWLKSLFYFPLNGQKDWKLNQALMLNTNFENTLQAVLIEDSSLLYGF